MCVSLRARVCACMCALARVCVLSFLYTPIFLFELCERSTGRKRERGGEGGGRAGGTQTDRQKGRQAGRQADRQTKRQTDKQSVL